MAIDRNREIEESPLYQGQDESIRYIFDASPVGGTAVPTSATASIWQVGGSGSLSDVSADHMSGTVSINGTDLTLPTIHSLGIGIQYRLEVQWVVSGNTFEHWADLFGER